MNSCLIHCIFFSNTKTYLSKLIVSVWIAMWIISYNVLLRFPFDPSGQGDEWGASPHQNDMYMIYLALQFGEYTYCALRRYITDILQIVQE